jgi:hypothetical protein
VTNAKRLAADSVDPSKPGLGFSKKRSNAWFRYSAEYRDWTVQYKKIALFAET